MDNRNKSVLWIVLSIITTFCCCYQSCCVTLVLGIIAAIFGFLANSAYSSGDAVKYVSYLKLSKLLCIISIAIGIICTIVLIVLTAIGTIDYSYYLNM